VTAGSAHWIAAIRARESERPDRLFDDPYARELAGEVGFAAMAASERLAGGENRFVPVRVRWFDDAILTALSGGVRQVVLLGAGLDTRAYRLAVPAQTAWFEVDVAEPLAEKDRVLRGQRPRCARTPVVADLAGDWRPRLEEAGFDPAGPTLWVAEGLLFYLAAPAVDALLTACAGAPDSALLADVMGTTGLTGEALRPYRESRAAAGQPPPFGTADPIGLFAHSGWPEVTVTAPGGPGANFGRLPDLPAGLIPGAAHLVAAGRRARASGPSAPPPSRPQGEPGARPDARSPETGP
jgi:methyltransferase (TIGR00027 family)